MKKILYSAFIIAAVVFATVSVSFANGADFVSGKITAKGVGAAPAFATNPAQAVALAKRAAVLDAYRNLAEYVNGVNLDSETTVQNYIVANDVVKTKVTAVIKGAKIIEEREMAGGGYSITVELPMYGEKSSLAAAVFKRETVKEPIPAPRADIVPSIPKEITVREPSLPTAPEIPAKKTAIGGFTGVIVDCSGLSLDTAMSPVIKDADGKKIYGHKNLDPDYIVANGMVSYSNGMESVARAGKNPLVLKAIRAENHSINPVLSLEDANRLLIENEVSHFLEATNVVFVR